jgi:Ca2+-binding RTX toxin-like protein
LIAFGSTLLFTADDGRHGTEPWMLEINRRPTDINLSSTSVDENQAAGAVVGTLTTSDPDGEDTFTYELVPGDGDNDNDLFSIEGDQLKTKAVLDYEACPVHRIFIRTTDHGGLFFDKLFIISVNNVNEPPSNLGVTPPSVDESQPAGTVVGTFFVVDPDSGDTFTYSLVSDPGFPDNALFTVDGDQLKTAAALDAEAEPTHSILVRATDQGGASLDKSVTIYVNNVNEAPSAVSHSYTAFKNEELAVGAPGVLEGASDPEGNAVTAGLAANGGPQHGQLWLNPDGSFTYEPKRDYLGPDSFTFRAFDGVFYSAPTTISVTVDYNPDPELQVPTGGSGTNSFLLRLKDGNVQLSNASTRELFINQPLSTLHSMTLLGADNKADTLTVDFRASGPWTIPGGLFVEGGTGTRTDTLVLYGATGADDFTADVDSVAVNSLAIEFHGVEQLTMDGGAGNDVYRVSDLGVKTTISDSSGTDRLDFSQAGTGVTVNLTMTTGQAQRVFGLGEPTLALKGTIENVVGTQADDYIKGNTANNRIEGLGGEDTLYGGSGNDLLDGGDDNDALYGDAGNDTLYGMAGNDTLRGGADHDWLYGGAGTDSLYGESGNDALLGGEDDDLLDAGTGKNLLMGGSGEDELRGGTSEEILIGGTTQYDDNQLALAAIMKEWSSTRSFKQRTDRLDAGILDAALGTIRLKRKDDANPEGTVIDDAARDVLLGSSGSDWFLDFSPPDEHPDKGSKDR